MKANVLLCIGLLLFGASTIFDRFIIPLSDGIMIPVLLISIALVTIGMIKNIMNTKKKS